MQVLQQPQEKYTDNSQVMKKLGFLPLENIDLLVEQKPYQQAIKRAMDIILSLTAIICLSPVLVLIAVLIKLDSKGSIFFNQERIGYKEKRFNMYKFRSMVSDAEAQFEKIKALNETNHIMFKSKDDPRITRMGKFLRKSSLDELPQLFNILKGDMSLVGPRPPLPRELINYEKWHHVKFLRPQGLTGLWQVSGRCEITNFDDVIHLDYQYNKNWNILMDLKIILKTVPVVLSAKGAD